MAMEKEISKNQFIEKYGEIVVKFISYYKFIFTYEAVMSDGRKITIQYGGNSDDIYRHSVNSETLESIRSIDPSSGYVYENEELVERFYEC